MQTRDDWETLKKKIISCTLCPRLREYCAEIAKTKRKSFLNESYWGKPVPYFGDTAAELVVIGLAPAAHGANRTGRMFTGDRSGEWLYRALFKAGFSNQPSSNSKDDGLELKNALITASARCAPPDNKPLPSELHSCSAYLDAELDLLTHARVFLVLGKIAYDRLWFHLKNRKLTQTQKNKPSFKHGLEITLSSKMTVLCSYHPSQQNTFTGKLTEPMFDSVFNRARELLSA